MEKYNVERYIYICICVCVCNSGKGRRTIFRYINFVTSGDSQNNGGQFLYKSIMNAAGEKFAKIKLACVISHFNRNYSTAFYSVHVFGRISA